MSSSPYTPHLNHQTCVLHCDVQNITDHSDSNVTWFLDSFASFQHILHFFYSILFFMYCFGACRFINFVFFIKWRNERSCSVDEQSYVRLSDSSLLLQWQFVWWSSAGSCKWNSDDSSYDVDGISEMLPWTGQMNVCCAVIRLQLLCLDTVVCCSSHYVRRLIKHVDGSDKVCVYSVSSEVVSVSASLAVMDPGRKTRWVFSLQNSSIFFHETLKTSLQLLPLCFLTTYVGLFLIREFGSYRSW